MSKPQTGHTVLPAAKTHAVVPAGRLSCFTYHASMTSRK